MNTDNLGLKFLLIIGLLLLIISPALANNTSNFTINYNDWQNTSTEDKLWTTFVFGSVASVSMVEWQQDFGEREACPFLSDHPSSGQMSTAAMANLIFWKWIVDKVPENEKTFVMLMANASVYWGWLYDAPQNTLNFNQSWRITFKIPVN